MRHQYNSSINGDINLAFAVDSILIWEHPSCIISDVKTQHVLLCATGLRVYSGW